VRPSAWRSRAWRRNAERRRRSSVVAQWETRGEWRRPARCRALRADTANIMPQNTKFNAEFANLSRNLGAAGSPGATQWGSAPCAAPLYRPGPPPQPELLRWTPPAPAAALNRPEHRQRMLDVVRQLRPLL